MKNSLKHMMGLGDGNVDQDRGESCRMGAHYKSHIAVRKSRNLRIYLGRSCCGQCLPGDVDGQAALGTLKGAHAFSVVCESLFISAWLHCRICAQSTRRCVNKLRSRIGQSVTRHHR